MLPDRRLRVSRIYDLIATEPYTETNFLDDTFLEWGTQDADFPSCRLIGQRVVGQTGPFRKPLEEPAKLERIWEEVPENDRVIVGEPSVSFDQYGRKSVQIDYLQLSAGTAIYSTVVGGTLGPVPYDDCLLQHFESTNDGTLIRSKYTFIDAGELSDTTEVKYNGKLLVRTIKYLNPSGPPAPSGYTLVATNTEYVEGLPVVGYVYVSAAAAAGGGGVIDTDTRYSQSSDEGTTGVTVTTIKYLSDPTVVANPITTPSGMVLIAIDQQSEAGYIVWIGTYAKGDGEVGREISYGQSTAGDGSVGTTITEITHLTASTVSTNPTSAPAGSVLIGISHREADGYRIWSVKYGQGVGLVVDESSIVETNALVTYHRVALGTAPTAPSATIGGTVTLFEESSRLSDGYEIFERRWAEGNGQSSITTAGQSDGALVYTVTTYTAAASTPAYPGSGTAYLVDLTQNVAGGFSKNRAVYHKPPATVVLKEMVNFKMPGTAQFVSNDLFISPPSDRTLLADVEISYDIAQLSDTPYAVEFGCFLSEAYIRTNNNNVGEGRRESLGYVLGNASSVTGTNDYYNGVLCDAFDASIASSSPTSRPSGDTVIDVRHTIYLVDITGTVVFKREKTNFTF